MNGILIGCLALIAALIGGTIVYAYRQSDTAYHAAHDACLGAGGAWVAHGPHSFTGSCLADGGRRR